MKKLYNVGAKILHDITQPLNFIRLSCGNIRARMENASTDDAEYLIATVMRIEEQVVRATELLQNLKTQVDDNGAAEGT